MPTINTIFNASGFDNSEFVSEISEEQKAAEELQKKQEDYDTYQEKLDARPGYSNFSGFTTIGDEEAFNDWEKTLYSRMANSKKYSDDVKTEYLNLVLGDSTTDGLTDRMFEYSQMIEDYQSDSSIVVDTSDANKLMLEIGYPTPTIGYKDYLNMLERIIAETPDLFVEVNVNTATEEEIIAAQESNIEFTGQLQSITNVFQYYSQPKVSLMSRFGNSPVVMNIAAIIAVVVLFIVRFPVVKKQQEYAWGSFKPLSLLTIPAVGAVFFIFFSVLLSSNMTVTSKNYDIYLDGLKVSTSDRIYLDEIGQHSMYLVNKGSDDSVSTTYLTINISDGSPIQGTELEVNQYGDVGAAMFEAEVNSNVINLTASDDEFAYMTVRDVIGQNTITTVDKFEPDSYTYPRYIEVRRNGFILPYKLVFIWPGLLFGTLFFMFMLMPKPMVKMYLEELYTINKFCGFLSYNMAYRSNARVLIEETLQSLEACKFAEDFAIIFFEKDRDMTDKIQDISQIYSYKFFEMYLGIVNIIFDEGVSDSTLKSLAIIQQFGDEYYNQADMFFKSKNGAMSSLMMIIGICMGMPIMVRKNTTSLFLTFVNTDTGYTFTIGCYLIWFGIFCLIYNMYKNNKIVRQEGRYA
ncbi:hypothetical protein R2F61_04695 [Mollicutes bacterium LVI A0078]|nr:hypothetical protein R2F61_04695 [Mollicutes bacterium LVI A0078]